MNIQPQFINSPGYMRFKKRIGLQAMEFIVKLGIRCQQTRSPSLTINDSEDLELILGIDDGGQAILDALVSSGLVDPEGGDYTCTFFTDMNAQLLSNWSNGAMAAQKAKAKQFNSNESNSNQSNSTQYNSTQLNRMPKQCLGNAFDAPKTQDIDAPF